MAKRNELKETESGARVHAAKAQDVEVLQIDGRSVRVTHPGKLYFSREVQVTKLDLVRYYLAVAPGALHGIQDRPIVLKRFVNGAEQEAFYQKRAPSDRPDWLHTATLSFPSGRTAEEIVVDDAAGLAWIVNLGAMELHPHPVRSGDLEHPDELRIDLDPGPGVSWADVQQVALEVQLLLEENGLRGWPKTSGSRGMHVYVRIEPRWSFGEVRRAALAVSREIERRRPALASSKWWKEERHGVFLDYNQNAKDRTTCAAYSVRPVPDARVSAPLRWSEVADCNPADFTLFTMPDRFRREGDPHSGIDHAAGSLEPLLEVAARDEVNGLGDAPWPPHFRKMEGEAARVAPSRARNRTGSRSNGRDWPASAGASASAEDAITPAKPRKAAPARRRATMPLVTVAQARRKETALEGLARWRARHAEAAALLDEDDVLVDSMRGRSSTWTRIRVNLRHVPEPLRPAQEEPDPDEIEGR